MSSLTRRREEGGLANEKKKKNVKKNVENTIFVRFDPPRLTRWQLEEYFSEWGPIKKCCVIHSSGKRKNKKSENEASEETEEDINKKSNRGFAFIKFVSLEDAKEAAKSRKQARVELDGTTFDLKVELGSDEKQLSKNELKKNDEKIVNERKEEDEEQEEGNKKLSKCKRTSRVIIRNLSFYANESHVKQIMEQNFGPVLDITLPRVTATVHRSGHDQHLTKSLHRGFCFVTFAHAHHAEAAIQPRQIPLQIKNRPVAIDAALNKTTHQRQQQQQNHHDQDEEQEQEDDESKQKQEQQQDHEDDVSNDDEEESDDEDEDDDQEDDIDSVDDTQHDTTATIARNDNKEEEEDEEEEEEEMGEDEAVQEKRTVFIRNLPFDVKRDQLFQLMRKFGYIQSMHLVTDPQTGIFKGTAFCAYAKQQSALAAIRAAADTTTTETDTNPLFFSTTNNNDAGTGLFLSGRRVYLDLAVTKGRASTLALEKQSRISGKDRRNLYLKEEGRVERQAQPDDESASNNKKRYNTNTNDWDNLPETDQLKRQRALSDKTFKLKSPLFFINPLRLSIRNLAKHVNEGMLKQLLVRATCKGLERSLVKEDDIIKHWRAAGHDTTRQILNRVEQMKETSQAIIPDFDTSNVRKFIPSLYIDRDFGGHRTNTSTDGKNKSLSSAPSRGFAFVDFTHHAHAMACLRELNNNVHYSKEYAAGGKRAMELKGTTSKKRKGDKDGKQQARIPRLIVDFVVENKAKARLQGERRAKQQENMKRQRLEQKNNRTNNNSKKEKKKGRGALQRERKRKRREQEAQEKALGTTTEALAQEEANAAHRTVAPQQKSEKPKGIKPKKKKRKLDVEDEKFERLVRSYRDDALKQEDKGDRKMESRKRKQAGNKRWFD